MPNNPYSSRKQGPPGDYSATGGRPADATQPHGEYAVPPLEAGGPYSTQIGYVQDLTPRISGTPDAQRLRILPTPVYDDEAYEPERRFRYQVETANIEQYPEFNSLAPGTKRFADRPEVRPGPDPRWTTSKHPGSYVYTRPFDQRYSHRFTGDHFSMADHRRQYEVGTMQGQSRVRRSTYYIEPQPWGTDVVDTGVPPDLPSALNVSPQVPQTRSWGVR